MNNFWLLFVQVLDSTERAVEHSLASTGRANERAKEIYSESTKTTCLTMLLVFIVTCVFIMIVLLIRVTWPAILSMQVPPFAQQEIQGLWNLSRSHPLCHSRFYMLNRSIELMTFYCDGNHFPVTCGPIYQVYIDSDDAAPNIVSLMQLSLNELYYSPSSP